MTLRKVTRVKIACQECGKEILVVPSIAKTKKFCSRKCRHKWDSEYYKGESNPNWRGGNLERICKWCGRTFNVSRRVINRGDGKFCSYRCYGMAQRKQPIKICKNCGKAFWRKGPKHFCSRECESQYYKGKNNPFYGKKHTKETIKKILKAVHAKPNMAESQLISLIDEYQLPFQYVGNGEVVIGGKCPDFIHSKGQKKVIELFGDYWHSPLLRNVKSISTYDGTKKHYSKYDYECLIIWECELSNPTHALERIIEFMGGIKIAPLNVPR